MKTEAENKRLFEEARELRANIKTCLHDRAKNNTVRSSSSCTIKRSTPIKKHNK